MTRIVLLNGPRQVGKDFIADRFIDHEQSSRKLPVMWPGKLAAMADHGVTPSQVAVMESRKDKPIHHPLGGPGELPVSLHGKTPREVYIEYGERMRAEEGDDYFARLWAQHARNYRGYGYIVVPDVRFQPEVDAASREFGQHNVLLVRVRRQDYDWQRDIGSYCKHIFAADFDNDVDASVSCPGLRLHEIVRGRML